MPLSSEHTKFPLRNFLQLVRVVTLAVRKQWPLVITSTAYKGQFIVTASKPYAPEIIKELGWAE